MQESVEEKVYNPLVSIIVITYNSAQFVLETLDSCKEQTYDNIELIISDDGSTDETVEICKNWLDENGNRFVRTQLVTTEENTGIPSNCNRGVKVSKGEWIKLIAGDDLLPVDSLKKYVYFISKFKNEGIIIAKPLLLKVLLMQKTAMHQLSLMDLLFLRDTLHHQNSYIYCQTAGLLQEIPFFFLEICMRKLEDLMKNINL